MSLIYTPLVRNNVFYNPCLRARTWTSNVSSCEPWASHRRQPWARKKRQFKRARLRSRTWRSFKKPFSTCQRSGQGRGLERVKATFPTSYISFLASPLYFLFAKFYSLTFGLVKSEFVYLTISENYYAYRRLCVWNPLRFSWNPY